MVAEEDFVTVAVETSLTTSNEEDGADVNKARQQAIQRSLQTLVHVSKCTEAKCELPPCPKMTKIVDHAMGCKRPALASDGSPGCLICKQLLLLSTHHAKDCREKGKCSVPFCSQIKAKLG